MDESQRFSDKHPLSDVLSKREGRYFVRPRPADKAPLPQLPPHILEQLGEVAPAQITSSSTAAASRTFHTLDNEDDTVSFVSAQEKLN